MTRGQLERGRVRLQEALVRIYNESLVPKDSVVEIGPASARLGRIHGLAEEALWSDAADGASEAHHG